MSGWALLVGFVGIIAVGRALVVGSASADGRGFRRDEEPALYWSIVGAAILITGFAFYKAFAS